MTTPLLTAEQVAEVMRLAATLGSAYWLEARARGVDELREAKLNTLNADCDLATHLRSLTAPGERAAFDPEALIRAVLLGGHSCDPQAVADDIREWVRAHATPARVPLAEEQIEKDLAQVREYPAQRHFFISGVRYAEHAHGISVTATNGDPHGD